MKRMKTVLVLLVICGVAACQSYIDFRKPMRLLYGGDTLIISLQGGSVIFSGEAAELVLRDSTLLEIIQAHGGGGGGEVYASNGAYKDGDTVKLGGGTRIKNNTTIGEQFNSIVYSDNQYQKGIMLYVSKNPSGSAQSTSSVQIKSHYNPSILPSEKLDSSTYIQFSSFHSPVGTSGKYAEARFNENGFYYTDTLGGRNANNQRWIPDKQYVDSVANNDDIKYGAITDNTPTASEINAITSLTPATAGAGFQVTIKDTNGTGLLYKIESDGTDWYYIIMTKSL